MTKLLVMPVLLALFQAVSFAQDPPTRIEGKEVFRSDDVVFRQIDEHTWVGTGVPRRGRGAGDEPRLRELERPPRLAAAEAEWLREAP